MKKLFIAVMAIATLSGCAKTYWYTRPGFDQTTFNRDMGHCRLVARTQIVTGVTFRRTWFSQAGPGGIDDGVMNDCMQAKGYSVSDYNR